MERGWSNSAEDLETCQLQHLKTMCFKSLLPLCWSLHHFQELPKEITTIEFLHYQVIITDLLSKYSQACFIPARGLFFSQKSGKDACEFNEESYQETVCGLKLDYLKKRTTKKPPN